MKQNKSESNRLVGWLVSYALDSKGKTFEIRAGRSLLSSEGSRETRVITVADDSIAAPHAALSASVRHRVMIQDIFSDSGTYVTKGAGQKEFKVSSPTEINHGDWVRVGDNVRLQVCLIDGPSR